MLLTQVLLLPSNVSSSLATMHGVLPTALATHICCCPCCCYCCCNCCCPGTPLLCTKWPIQPPLCNYLEYAAAAAAQGIVWPFCHHPWCACHHCCGGLQKVVLCNLVLQQTLQNTLHTQGGGRPQNGSGTVGLGGMKGGSPSLMCCATLCCKKRCETCRA